MKKSNIFKSSLIYFISVFLFLVLKLLSSYGLFSFLGSDSNLYVNIFIQIGIMLLIPLSFFVLFNRKKPKFNLQTLQLSKVNFKTVLLSFVSGFVMFIAVIIISATMSQILSLFGYKNPFTSSGTSADQGIWRELFLPIITSCFLPGFCEEFLNRGILLNGLSDLSPKKAIIYSSVLFGLLHYNINQVFYAILVGLLLGTITYFCKSIYPAMIMHFTNNFCSTYFSYASAKGLFGKNIYNYLNYIFEGPVFLVAIQIVLALVVLGFALYNLMILIYKQTSPNRMNLNLHNIAERYLGTGVKTKRGKAFTVDDKVGVSDELFVKMKDEVLQTIAFEKNQNISYAKKFLLGKAEKKKELFEKLFLYASLFLTLTVTVFTFIWGVL